jgi:hypothetical protein
MTMALAASSPPVDTGSGCLATDQRGVPRPQGAGCDAGAYELVTKPLEVTITSGPSGTVTTPDVSFSFSAEAPSTFQCKLDGGTFQPCSSPFSAGPLTLGQHTFSVQATDSADKMGPVTASRTFTIVAVGSGGGAKGSGVPDTLLGSHPKAKLKAKKKAKVSFSFSSSIAGSTFQCKLDRASFAPCTSPKSYKVKPGKYRFEVEAVNAGQVDPTPANFSFRVKKKL